LATNVCAVLSGSGKQFCLLMSFAFMIYEDLADGCARVWRERIERFHPENVIQRDSCGGVNVLIWNKIDHHGKTNLVKVNGTPISQLCFIVRESWFMRLCHF
jgi:hypothetical protein